MTKPEIYDVRVAGRDFDDILAGNDVFGEEDIDPLYPRMLKILRQSERQSETKTGGSQCGQRLDLGHSQLHKKLGILFCSP